MNKFIIVFALLFAIALGVAGCGDDAIITPTDSAINPFYNGSNLRSMIVVISDIHLGADLDYAECKDNLGALENLIKQVKASPNIKELVIAGDLVDEWFVPASVDTFQGKDEADFVQRVALANQGVFDALNSIIKEGEILVTYIPGNHDIAISAESIELVLPGINQARDPELGLGTYVPADQPMIAMEHGHRYNFFCAPDPLSNQDVAPGTILPPGYFFTRIAATYVYQGFPPAAETLVPITLSDDANESQRLLYVYYRVWKGTIDTFTLENMFDEKIIITNVNGFTDTYSVDDFVPYQRVPNGEIDVDLYNGIQNNWAQRQVLNHVAVSIPTEEAIAGSADNAEMDKQATIQYFLNPDSDKRIVLFGHTHEAKIQTSNDVNGQKCIYVNSGTWIDENAAGTRNFVVISPQVSELPASQTFVRLYNCENDVVTEMASESVRLP